MKKVSIIIPAYNVQNYIGACLDSLVCQTLSDLEIIVINDGSIDNTKAVIEAYRAKYPDMVKIFNVENSGAAAARNVGLDAATGEYIGFVDSDDYVRQDTFELLYNAAKEKDAQIVSCGYCREGVHSTRKMPFGNRNIKAEDVFDKNIFEEPLLFDEVPYLWNKIFKADIIQKNNIRFHKDLRIYEDLVFTYEAFLFADKISRVEEYLYYYVVSRDTSLTYRFTEKRFDIVKATELLLEFYEKNKSLTPEIKNALVYVVLKHIYVMLNRKTTVSEKKLKLKYLDTIFKFLDKTFPDWKENYYFEKQNRNVKTFTSKGYWKFCILFGRIHAVIGRINKILKNFLKMPRRILKFVFGKRVGQRYIKLRQKPIDCKCIFLYSQQGKNLNGNMFYLAKELCTNEEYSDYTIYLGVEKSCIEKFKALLLSYNILDRVKFVFTDTTPMLSALARAKYLFTDTSLPTYFIKRKEQVYLNTWHGTPLKTLGKATANDFFDIANVQKNFIMSDYILYPNVFMRDIMLRDYMLPEFADNKIMLCGYPRNEIFLQNTGRNIKRELSLEDKEFIAYMPTWRGNVRNVSSDMQIEITANLLSEIDEKLSDNQILYVNMHPYVGDKIDLSVYKNIRKFPAGYETYEFLSCCDTLITDYSSVFFDFAASRKKIVLFIYDEEEYLADRGMYLDIKSLPFKKAKDVNSLIKAINGRDITKKAYNEFIDTYCKYDSADICKKICDKVILGKENDILIEDMPKINKKRILYYAGSFLQSRSTEDFISAATNTVSDKYLHVFSYITRKVRRNAEQFRRVLPYLSFWGQLGSYTLVGKLDSLCFHILKEGKKNFPKISKRLGKIFSLERERNYLDTDFEMVVLFGDLFYRKIYEFAHFPCKTIYYVNSDKHFNMRVHPSIYRTLDKILVTDEDTFNLVKEYIGNDKNIELISPVQSLNEFEKYL